MAISEEEKSENTKSTIKPTQTPTLDNFSINLNEEVKKGNVDKIIGREQEVQRIINILCRRKKRNALLLGDAGVGKTSILHKIAQLIEEKKVPRTLANKKVYLLSITDLMAGTRYRGDLEQRIKTLITEVSASDNIILVIDEIHNIVNNNSGGGMDISNLLKPALTGKIQVIGCSTLSEARKQFESDSGINRRFERVIIEPPTVSETIEILEQIKDKYEKYHHVKYPKTIIEEIVKLSVRYIPTKFLPDSAIDCLDEIGSSTHIKNINVPKAILTMEKELNDLKEQKIEVVKQQKYEQAAGLRDKERTIIDKLEIAKKHWMSGEGEENVVITLEDVHQVISSASGIPVKKLDVKETEILLKLEDTLNSSVIGQKEAVTKIVKAIKKSKVGLRKSNKPIATLLFIGPTGTGKTFLTRKLAKEIFGNEDAMIRVDMNEYGEKFSMSRLIGSPPGYVGSENNGGELTIAIKNKPHCILLLDEIEKAHPDIWDLFLRVFDEGKMKDSAGNSISFSNVIIIMTSNIGTKAVSDFGKGVGFGTSSKNANTADDTIQKEIGKKFKPEFINRIDSIVTFNELSKENLYKIIDLYLVDLQGRLTELTYTLELSSEAKDLIIKKGFDEKFGARAIERTIGSLVEDSLTELILNGIDTGSTIVGKVVEGAEEITYEVVKPKKIKKGKKLPPENTEG